ncbi:MAG: FAD-dependent oxidoreductase [Firmicutes bacterium]|nr:FAD-dependent oxidoreductase [Alicyclobacillaceae bacterium]MCL6497868.1 FAD-dependent oxidoreductase [Bacillota bacterium]
MTPRLVIVGGSDAGISAALQARKCAPDVQVQVIYADAYPNFSVCGLPYYIGGAVSDWPLLAHRTAAELEAAGITLMPQAVAEAIDPSRQIVWVQARGQRQALPYDQLVIATGAKPIAPPIPGLELPGVFMLHTIDQGRAIRGYLEAYHPRRAVVVGAGYIGLEMTEVLVERNIAVTLLEQAPAVLPTVDLELGQLLTSYLEGKGVSVHCRTRVTAIEPTSDGLMVHSLEGGRFPADLVMVVVGVEPDTGLAKAAGARTGIRGAIAVDFAMRTSLPHVFAAGDCVETYHRLLRRPVYLPLGTTAHKQGRVAGENAVGGSRHFAGSLGTQVVKLFDWAIARTGLREDEAKAWGVAARTVAVEAWDHKSYYPEAELLHLRVTFDRTTHRLLGAQMVGPWRAAVAKRIDVMATAISCELSLRDVENLDLSYTPPLGTPWDPWQIAAEVGQESVERAP